MKKAAPYVIGLLLLVLLILRCDPRNKMYEEVFQDQINKTKLERDLLQEELDCLLEEREHAYYDNEIITVTDQRYKNKYFKLLKDYENLETENAAILTIVLSYHKLDSLAAIVEYPKK